MEWMNIHISVVDSVEFKSAEPVDQATWFKLFRFCCGQENGGVIEKAAELGDRQWMSMASCTLEEIKRPTRLWKFENDDLLLNFYNTDSEKEYRAKRRGGRIGNLRRWGKKKPSTPHTESLSDTQSESETESTTKLNKTKLNKTTGAAVEIPSEETVLRAAADYPGDMARGIPPVIPEGWAMSWFAWRSTPVAGPFPEDWIGDLTRRFRSGWVNGDPRTRGGHGKNGEKQGALSANVEAIARQKQQTALRAELRELEQEIESLVQAGAAVPTEKKDREREINKELAE